MKLAKINTIDKGYSLAHVAQKINNITTGKLDS